MKKVITKKDFSVEWLLACNYYVDLPPDFLSRILVLEFIYKSIKDDNIVNTLLKVVRGVSRQTILKYQRDGWSTNKINVSKFKLLSNNLLILKIKDVDTGRLTGYSFHILHKDLIEKIEPKTISVKKAIEIREDLDKEEESLICNLTSISEIEEVALNICQIFASGRITIYEACARQKISYLEFFKWVIGMDSVRQMYEDAVGVAKFVTESQIYTVSSNMILERLKTGYTTNSDIVYDAIWVNGEKVFTEKAKRVNTREINLSELIRVIAAIRNETDMPTIDADDFSSMSDSELTDYIKEIRGRITQKKIEKHDNDENN